MDQQYKVALVLVNMLLGKFGLKIQHEKLKFIYRIRDYSSPGHLSRAVKILTVTEDLEKAFEFLKLKKETVLNSKSIFEMTGYITAACPYFTKGTAKYIEYSLNKNPDKYEDKEIIDGLKEVVRYIKHSQQELPEFDHLPHNMYANLREIIVREFFASKVLDREIIKLKREYLPEEAKNKFTSLKAVTWVSDLKKDSDLAGNAIRAFVKHMTDDNMDDFPSYTIDTPEATIRRDFVAFFDWHYTQSHEYRNYILEGSNNEDVIY